MKTKGAINLGLLVTAAAIIISPISAVTADELEAFHACVEIENDIERLQCFDEAATEFVVSDESLEPIDSAQPEADRASATQQPSTQTADRPASFLGIQEADEKMVEGCDFLGTVIGKSGWGGVAAGMGSKGAMRSAKRRAAKLGATHIVAGGFDVGSGFTMEVSTFQARAYRCPKGSGAAPATRAGDRADH